MSCSYSGRRWTVISNRSDQASSSSATSKTAHCNADYLFDIFIVCSSVVPKTALKPFCPDSEPYTVYAKTIRRFFSDAAIVRATAYWNTGEIPATFKWLAVLEVLEQQQSDSINGSDQPPVPYRKRSLVVESGKEDSEGEFIDPLTPAPTLPLKNGIPKAMAPPKKKPTASKPKAKPAKKPSDEMDTPKATAQRRASVDVDVGDKSGGGSSKNIPPSPPYKPSTSEQFSLIGHLLPRPLLPSLNK